MFDIRSENYQEIETRQEFSSIMQRLNIKSKTTLRNQYLHPAIKMGLVKLTNPENPNSSKQTYYKD